MALNPPLTEFGEPCRVEGEFFIMKRKGIEFEIKVQKGNKYTGKGMVIMTTCRLVLLNNKNDNAFKAFDIPLALLLKESFEQPFFGANYIQGTCTPLMNMLPGNIDFKIWFMEGGCNTFVHNFLSLVNGVRKNKNKGPDPKLITSLSNGTFVKTAYLDPNDPSTIYLEQPNIPKQNVISNSNNNNNWSNVTTVNSNNHPNNFNFNQNSNSNFTNNNYENINQNQTNNGNWNMNNNNYNHKNSQLNKNIPYNPNFNANQIQNNNVNMSNNYNYNQNSTPIINGNTAPIIENNFNNINNPFNPYPDFSVGNENLTRNENSFPTLEEINSNQPVNPNIINNISNMNYVNLEHQNNNNAKYFGFWGPEIKKNN